MRVPRNVFAANRYTESMDSVRLGRALGAGTRRLAKTVVEVSQAVTAPDPTASSATQNGAPKPAPSILQPEAAHHTIPASARAVQAVKRSGFWKPLTNFTSVLWLEVTGTFFAVFAFVLGSAAWKNRGLAHSGLHAGAPLYAYTVVSAVFVYFTVSSFVRARRREKQTKR